MPDFIVDHYLLIMILVAFILFAIIGYIVDSTKNKKSKETSNVVNNEEVEVSVPEEAPLPEEVQEESLEETSETEPEEEFVLTADSEEDTIPEAEDNG